MILSNVCFISYSLTRQSVLITFKRTNKNKLELELKLEHEGLSEIFDYDEKLLPRLIADQQI